MNINIASLPFVSDACLGSSAEDGTGLVLQGISASVSFTSDNLGLIIGWADVMGRVKAP